MPNALTKALDIYWENSVLGFDAGAVASREVVKFNPDPQGVQRGNDVVYRPEDYMMSLASGLDISGAAATDLIQRMVPAVYKQPQNVKFTLDAREMRDPEHMRRAGEAAGKRLAAKIESDIQTEIRSYGANVIRKVGNIAWDDVAQAEAVLIAKGAPAGVARKLLLNAFDNKVLTGDLGGRGTVAGVVQTAYERSRLPSASGFDTFRTDIAPTLAAVGTVTGTTINGNQSYTPSAMASNLPVDNRQMTLTVAGANVANIKAGDTFTIGTGATQVNSVHSITKDDTGVAQTFRVLSVAGGGTSLTITPPIISSGSYQNVTVQATNGAALNFQNNVTKAINTFWCDGAVELMVGKLAFPTNMGPYVRTVTTEAGIPVLMSASFNDQTGVATVRYTALYGVSVLEPELCGFILPGQS